jgi:hypothetical protein
MSFGSSPGLSQKGWFIPWKTIACLQCASRTLPKKTKIPGIAPRCRLRHPASALPMIRDLENAGITVVGNDVASLISRALL